MKKVGIAAIWIAMASIVMPAQAEVLKISALYPAEDSAANLTASLAVEPFRGSGGDDLSYAIERELERVVIRQQPYFEMLSYRGRREPDGLITGSADIDVYESDTTGTKNICVEYDATKVLAGKEKEAKCVKYKNVQVPCLKRTISLEATVRLSSGYSRRSSFLEDYSRLNEQTSCPNMDDGFTSERTEIKNLISELALEVRNALAPNERQQSIRVLERRKGMEKTQSKAFKAAVKMTKRDGPEACRMWLELSNNSPEHLSLMFNLGLCAEQAGKLPLALEIYRDAETRFGSKRELSEGRARVAERLRAEDAWQERQAALASNSEY
ncbi:MAG: hypothetical protein ABJ360_25925 [Roseobacter sp.]|uniref:hypothetical protein n=1 Tax=Parasphingorhabdus sp. TaxID=2709688 RepID=UPI003267DE65